MRLVKGFFALFLPQKSAKLASHSRVPASVSPSTPAAQLEVVPLPDSIEWLQLRERFAGKACYWNRRTDSTVWQAPAGVEVVWYGEKDEEGGIWFWHRDKRVSTFDLPSLPPGWFAFPPAQGGFQKLGGRLSFQQFFEFDIPLIPFIDRVFDRV